MGLVPMKKIKTPQGFLSLRVTREEITESPMS